MAWINTSLTKDGSTTTKARQQLCYVDPANVGKSDCVFSDTPKEGFVQVDSRPSVFHVYDPELVGKWRKDAMAAVGMTESEYLEGQGA